MVPPPSLLDDPESEPPSSNLLLHDYWERLILSDLYSGPSRHTSMTMSSCRSYRSDHCHARRVCSVLLTPSNVDQQATFFHPTCRTSWVNLDRQRPSIVNYFVSPTNRPVFHRCQKLDRSKKERREERRHLSWSYSDRQQRLCMSSD